LKQLLNKKKDDETSLKTGDLDRERGLLQFSDEDDYV